MTKKVARESSEGGRVVSLAGARAWRAWLATLTPEQRASIPDAETRPDARAARAAAELAQAGDDPAVARAADRALADARDDERVRNKGRDKDRKRRRAPKIPPGFAVVDVSRRSRMCKPNHRAIVHVDAAPVRFMSDPEGVVAGLQRLLDADATTRWLDGYASAAEEKALRALYSATFGVAIEHTWAEMLSQEIGHSLAARLEQQTNPAQVDVSKLPERRKFREHRANEKRVNPDLATMLGARGTASYALDKTRRRLADVRGAFKQPPAYADETLVTWLLDHVSGGGGGRAGKLALASLAGLLVRPSALAAAIERRGGPWTLVRRVRAAK